MQRSRNGNKTTTPKNHKRRRVDMSKQLTEVLKTLKAERRKATFQQPEKMSPYVFLSASGVPVDGDNFRRRVFEKLLKLAGLAHCRIHDLRHTFASLLLQNGESLKYVQEQLGHSSIQITADVYGHLIPGSNKAAVDRLDAPIRNPGATGADPEGSESTVSC